MHLQKYMCSQIKPTRCNGWAYISGKNILSKTLDFSFCLVIGLSFFGFFLLAEQVAAADQPGCSHNVPVKLGVDVLFEKHLDLITGKRVGLITNPTGLDSKLNSTIQRFRAQPDVTLVALYGPEHGVRGNAQAGEHVRFYFDKQLKLPVFSLYGQTRKPPVDMFTNIDAYMREFDTQHTGKQVQPDMLKSVDVLVFDIQDVGTRVYTYIATMAYAMQAAAESGIPFVVLDRPNPINGVVMEGPVLEYPKYSSFIGLYPIPLRHGMTVGELAQLFNAKYLSKKAKLTVVPMENWRRAEWFDQTSLPWVLPSPNLPTLESAIVYPGQVILEGTNLSEGRGTTKPFEFFGAPWIDGYVLAKELNALNLPGVKFREIWFTPTFSKFSDTTKSFDAPRIVGDVLAKQLFPPKLPPEQELIVRKTQLTLTVPKAQLCGGCQLHVIDRNAYRSIATTLAILRTVKKLYGDKLELHDKYFDKVLGTSTVREAFGRGESVDKIVEGFKPGLEQFAKTRQPLLLYH
ncbi:MAG: exo-beta-N-acetylmuramidase NamZ family protein [Thermoguttaceae bacterium]